MKKNFYSAYTILLFVLWMTFLHSPAKGQSQGTGASVRPGNHPGQVITQQPIGLGSMAEALWQEGEPRWRNSMMKTLAVDDAGLTKFLDNNRSEYNKDRGAFFNNVGKGAVSSKSVDNFFSNLQIKYAGLYHTQGSSAMRGPVPPPPTPQAVCNPSCYNINFQSGDLSGWSAYYAVNGGSGLTGKTGGPAGAVTQAGGPNPNTSNSYHVQLMPATGNDPVAGGFIPYTPPLGGQSSMVGDGANYNYGAGILEQTYQVTAAAPILTIQYAVVIEDPGSSHAAADKPYFKMEVLDINGNPISQCGQYSVIAGPGLPGFRAFYYAAQGDTVYCRPWTTAFVPLNNYIGQCVTVRFTTADCAQGGHFGYAYVAATCSQIDLQQSSTVFCQGQQSATITGPAGAASYKWSTNGGCIPGSSTQQVLKVTCGGTYSLVVQSAAGVQCVDTFTVVIPNVPYGPPPTSCFTPTRVCSGNATQFNGSCSTPGVKYYWDFYNSGQINDSSGANSSFTFSNGGNYPVRLHVVSPNGCASDTIINVPVDTTGSGVPLSFSNTITNATSCTVCDGKLTFVVTGASSNGDQLINSFDNTIIKWSLPPFLPILTATANPAGPNFDSLTVNPFAIPPFIPASSTIYYSRLCPGNYTLTYQGTPGGGSAACSPGGTSGMTTQVTIGGSNANITSNIVSSNASCNQNNGSATVTGMGGNGTYTYSWSPTGGTNATASGLAAGTYSIKITDGNGCTGTAKLTITTSNILTALITPFDVSCFGVNNGAIKVLPISGSGPYIYSWSPNVSSVDSAFGLAPGSYTVFITDGAGCTGSKGTTISQPTQVVSSIITSVTNVSCGQKGSATADVTGGYAPYTYSWSNGELGASATALNTGQNVVTVTDAFGCTDTSIVTVTSTGAPDANAGPDTTVCSGFSTVLNGSSVTPGVTFSWSPGGTLSCTSCLSPTATPTATTQYMVIVTDGTGCSATDIVQVSVSTSPNITISPSSSICTGGNVTLTTSGGLAYAWSTGQSGIGLASIVVTPTTTTNYTVTGVDINGCMNSANNTITVNGLPPVSVSLPSSVCLGGSATITASGGIGYSWSNGQSGIGLNSIVVIPPLGLNTYTVTVVDINGCINSDTTNVTVNALTNVLVSPNVTICPGSSAQLTASGGVSYSWSNGQTLSSITVLPLTTTTYSVDVTDVNGCKGTDSVMVTINPRLMINISPSDSICIGSSIQITSAPTGGTTYSYTWTPGITAGLNDSTIQSPTASPTITTTYSVEVNDINGCKGDTSISITVSLIPVVTASLPVVICAGTNTQLTASGGLVYLWSNMDTGASITVTPPLGTTSYTVAGTDVNGCADTATTTVVVNPLPIIIVSSDSTLCASDSLSILAAGGFTYLWTPAAGLSSDTIANPTAVPLITTTYTVNSIDANGCTGTNQVTITVEAPPVADAGLDSSICIGQTVQLNATGGNSYSWTPATDLSSTTIQDPVSVPLSTITYTVEVFSTATCPPDTDEITITVYPAPVVQASSDTTVILGSDAQLTSTGTGLFYTWTPSIGLSCTDCLNPLASPLKTTQYIITTIDQYGCVNADTVLIEVDDIITLYVPSAFTPYQYYDNNVFYAYGVGINHFEFYVFDRWGTLIFETTDPTKGWDGTYLGQMVQSDVYVWLAKAVSITGKSISKTGPVTVLR